MPSKVALITASSAGLGAAIVKALAEDYRVVVNYFSHPDKAEAVIRECMAKLPETSSSTEPRFHTIQADISKKFDVQRLVEETIQVMGRLDVVISNAGWTQIVNFYDLEQNIDEADWDKCFAINVKTHLWLLHAAKRYMDLNEDGGSFVSIASLAGVIPSGSSIPYAVTKAAQIHLLKCLAAVCGPKIQCNSVSPGLMMTEWGQRFPEATVNAVTEKGALKRLTTAEDVADLIRTMILSRSLTGQNIVIDCGISM
ncbi:short chain dehydrogenase [Penicillium riverlandense]|uniref:short chain dehydrogenase n=1 Tax=Penicillium riverlandense TaxID=1903569 RepID=UPI0025469CA6|nr:short chain dehydrogenase [Penicillium riverlandense]KAJ5812075.1 short chain dehydrogenase [Penicillium riverlandense]